MGNEILNNARARVPALYKLAQTGKTDCDKRELRRRKKRVDADQRQDAEKTDQNHVAILTARWRASQ
jgi:hypothetical protein